MTGVSANAATIVGAAQQAGDFITLLMASKAAGVDKALEGPEPFTLFAPNDTALPPPQGPRPGARLALKAEGGVLPLRWIVNGTPVRRDRTCLRRQAAWTPDGAGFARVSVIDARGARDRVLVRLE